MPALVLSPEKRTKTPEDHGKKEVVRGISLQTRQIFAGMLCACQENLTKRGKRRKRKSVISARGAGLTLRGFFREGPLRRRLETMRTGSAAGVKTPDKRIGREEGRCQYAGAGVFRAFRIPRGGRGTPAAPCRRRRRRPPKRGGRTFLRYKSLKRLSPSRFSLNLCENYC